MLAYVSNSFRRVTLALFSPNPTGVSSGPFSTTRERLIESMRVLRDAGRQTPA